MLKYIFVIALAFQVCVFAENNKTESSTLNIKCTGGTFNQKLAYDDYSNTLTTYIRTKDPEAFKNLTNSFTSFVSLINSTCAEGKLPFIKNTPLFLNVIEIAVKDNHYSKFINNNGLQCVNTVKKDLQQCVLDNVGTPKKVAADAPSHDAGNKVASASGERGPVSNTGVVANNIAHDADDEAEIVKKHYKYFNQLLMMTYLEFNDFNCELTKQIRTCVKTVMHKQNTSCTTKHWEFVDSLFNFTLNMCPPPREEIVEPNGANSFIFNPVVILLPLVGTMLIK